MRPTHEPGSHTLDNMNMRYSRSSDDLVIFRALTTWHDHQKPSRYNESLQNITGLKKAITLTPYLLYFLLERDIFR